MSEAPARALAVWKLPLLVWVAVLGAQLWLVSRVGTDIPFHDQWDAEGRRLYPAMQTGTWHFADLLRPHNEHRIVWTHLLNMLLFRANGGQWDPLVQLVVNAGLHAACAAGLMFGLGRRLGRLAGVMTAVGVTLLALPVAGWHNALWGFQSQVYFALGFGLLAFICLDDPAAGRGRTIVGWVALVSAMLAMGPGMLAPAALAGVSVLRCWKNRRMERAAVWRLAGLCLLLAGGLATQVSVPEHAALRAQSFAQFVEAAARILAWPHVEQPWAALVLNLPWLVLVFRWIGSRSTPSPGEEFILLIGGWSVLLALAAAWTRGGGAELSGGVPSRYVDLVVLLPLANLGSLSVLAREKTPALRLRCLAALWGLFLLVGWLGLSAQMMRGIILPLARDPLAPVRLAVAFQRSNDPAVYVGQPRLLVPHPSLDSVRAVLHDPRLQGALPPSLQAEQPRGPLSRGVRTLLGREQ